MFPENGISLNDLLNAYDDGVLTKNPVSVRLPVHIVARLQALNGIHKHKTRSDLIVFCLKLMLEMMERQTFPETMPKASGDPERDSESEFAYILGRSYRRDANKYYRQLLKESGHQPPHKDLFTIKPESKDGK